ncbi:hypothetical protein CEP54_014768 [Fusarium duplospermum]|uniref:C2H2-type domain-containing protein n=1 Tax=Fusarium duplospermum TaxID=1325734 RepID=A0A428NTV3_9HYPO|nr:hypothetical protein CEP54_014768 [Fusarium duplospermum]
MTRRILLCQGKCNPSQPPTPKKEPNTQAASTICQIPFGPSAGLIRKSSQPSPPADSAGIKQERSGQPSTHAWNQRFRGSRSSSYPYSSENDLDSSSSTSGSDSDDSSCSDSEHSSPGAAQEYILPYDHRFQSSRPELVKSALDSLDAWMKSARYVLPPDDRLPPRKRLRILHRKEGDDGDDSIDGFVAISPPDGYFHLACPFYIYNPARYQQCLLQFDLRSIEDVIRHLRRHHMKPPYCPCCSQTFDTLSSRDSHILERMCELRDPQPIQGLNFYQKSELKRRDRIYLGETKRWQRIYATAFPNSGLPRSPYLVSGCGKAVSMARDFWRANGRLCVSQFLERGEFLGEEGERDRLAEEALCNLALEDMVPVIVRRYGY